MDFLVQICADEPNVEPIFDTVRDRYLILSEGWQGQECLYGVLIHLDIRSGKVWIQRNQTEVEVEDALFGWGIAEGELHCQSQIHPSRYRSRSVALIMRCLVVPFASERFATQRHE